MQKVVQSIKRGGGGPFFDHLLFADDALVFGEASQEHLTYLCWILMCFEVISGLKINLEKSQLTPVGRVEEVDMLAIVLGCNLATLLIVYLGLPLGASFKSIRV